MENANLFEEIPGIYELTKEDFDITDTNTTISNKDIRDKYGMLIVYNPNCPKCIQSVPLFDYMSQNTKEYDIKIATVNSKNIKNHNDELVQKLNVKSFPTIFTINKGIKNNHKMKGSLRKYEGDRDIHNLMIELYVMKNSL